ARPHEVRFGERRAGRLLRPDADVVCGRGRRTTGRPTARRREYPSLAGRKTDRPPRALVLAVRQGPAESVEVDSATGRMEVACGREARACRALQPGRRPGREDRPGGETAGPCPRAASVAGEALPR